MLRLKLFGVPSLARDGVLLGGRAVQRHRIALLALLALAPGHRLGRDSLIAALWPDSDADRGRNLLKVATYVLRSALEDGVLLSAGDEMRLNTASLEVDVAEFEAAIARGEHARAAALYEGPFMDGFFLSEAPELEHWIGRERDRLASQHRRSLEALADAARDAGDLPAAAEWWRARAVQDPYDSRVALRLMESMALAGNRAGALQHASIHQRLLQTEFGVESPPEIAELVEQLRREPAGAGGMADAPGRQQRPVTATTGQTTPIVSPRAPVLAASAPVGTFPAAAAPALAPETVHGRVSRVRRAWLAAAAALLVVLSAAGAARVVWPRAADPQQSIVVLPFVNLSADADYEYFSDGLTEEIITRLAAIPDLKVISRTSAMHYKGIARPLPEIARELGVGHVLEGSVRREGGRVRISAQLIDARDDGHLWADNYEYELRDGFRVQEEIAHEVAQALEMRLQSRVRRLLVRQGTRDPEAWELYERGRYLWNTRTREGHERAIVYFHRAIDRDSGYADAYAGLAHAYLTAFQLNLLDLRESEAYDRVKWAAERALALDDESADAHLSFAIALKWQRNWPGAEREFRRAIALNPGHATARSWYSLLLRGMGRPDDALREARHAAGLDPFGIVITHNYAWQCYVARDYECSAEGFRRSLEITPYPGSYRGLGVTLSCLGQHEEAIAAVERAVELAPQRPDFLADLAFVQAMAGRHDEARATLARAKTQPREGFNIARAHVALSEPDSAFAWLERSNWRWPHRATRDDPALDPLRGDARFAQLVSRIDREMGMR